MLVPISWLRDFAPFDLDPRALGAVFDDLGMVVEGIDHVGEGLEGVSTARVVEIAKIAGADKIRRVVVDAGGPTPVQVVCGAWNFNEGDAVALARVGAVLPGGFTITQRKMKGVQSDGMLCSPAELGLGEDSAGILVLPDDLDPEAGAPLAEVLAIERDVVYDLAIEGNRPDAMCIAGVARDAAARLGLPFSIPVPPAVPMDGADAVAVTVRIDAPDLCQRFTARVLEGIVISDSPAWLARRLTLAGMRPINSVVDASNYVMLELGQPTHPYDLDLLGGGGFVVRAARPGESLETLDGVIRRLGEGTYPDALICDGNDSAVGIAGIMGGASSEISDSTTRTVLEAANFTPMAVARTARRLALRTEASVRFERGVDVEGIDRAVGRFCQLVALTSPALVAVGGLVDARVRPSERIVIRLRTARVNAVLGTELDGEAIEGYLNRIGFEPVPAGRALHDVTVPSFRPDITREIDLIEEVARHHGYSNVARTVPSSPHVGRLTGYQRDRRRVRDILAGLGFSEAVCSQLLGPGDHAKAGWPEVAIAAVEPLAREESLLRMSLLPGMLRTVAFNADRRNADVAMFEIGHTFRRPEVAGEPAPELPDEREMLGLVLAGDGAAADHGARGIVSAIRVLANGLRIADLSMAATAAPGMHPGRTASVTASGGRVGYGGEVDPDVSAAWGIEGRVGWAELDLGALLSVPRRSEHAVPVSRFPSSDLDLAFVVEDATPAAAVEATLANAAGSLLERLALFDVYRGPGVADGARSLGFRLRVCALDRTLTEGEIGELRARCIAAVETAHPAKLRG